MAPDQESTPPTTPTQTTPPTNGAPNETTPPISSVAQPTTTLANAAHDPQSLIKKRNRHIWLTIGLILVCTIIPIWAIFALISSVFGPFGHYVGKMNTYDELISYADNLPIIIYDGNQNKFAKLTGHYDVISNEVNTENSHNQKQRVVTLKLKDSGYSFDITSSPSKCLKPFDASCFQYTYEIITNYGIRTYEDYILAQYNQKIGYDTRYNATFEHNTGNATQSQLELNTFDINSNSALDFAINYVKGFIDYCDQLPYKIYSGHNSTTIYPGKYSIYFHFPSSQTTSHFTSAYIYLTLNNDNRYVIEFPISYEHPDATLETYLNNFITTNHITLEP